MIYDFIMYYVYVDYRKDSSEPFYVGKGNKDRIRDFKNRNVVWHRIVAKHGVRREIVCESSDHDHILKEEIRLIAELKTRAEFGGANLTDGGEGSLGWNPSEETRKKMSEAWIGREVSDECRKKMSAAHKKFYEIEEHRQAAREHLKELWTRDEYRKRMCEKRKGEGNIRAKITEDNVREVRLAWSQCNASEWGMTKAFCVKYADKFNVTSENIFGIIKNKSWKHVH